MKISCNWLTTYVDTGLTPEEIAEVLTSTGLEVEGIHPWESIRGGLTGVVIGEVLSCEKHPDADKLTVCKVDVAAGELLNIVCGAPNVAPGQKVPVAMVGATLYPFGQEEGFTIKKAKIRGIESVGMICAEDELGIGASHAGIMVLHPDAEVGMQAADYFGVESDVVLEIGLTPNRTDAMSHFGVARDLAAAVACRNKQEVTLTPPPAPQPAIPRSPLPLKVDIAAPDDCKRYSAIALDNVKVGPSPSWLQNRLKAIGLKPLNNIVDITNFVLHEWGHPLHAFDYDHIKNGHIVVGKLRQGTPFVTLDGVERKLSGQELMICDPEKPLCIAGVYGGMGSGVTTETKRVVLESAWFDTVSVRRTARHHGLNTDASFRFERGADPLITLPVMFRAAALICQVAGGEIASPICDVGEYTDGFKPVQLLLRRSRVDLISGVTIPAGELESILQKLDFIILKEEQDGLFVEVPSYRFDVTREVDVIEEVIRIYGMNTVPVPQKVSVSFPPEIDTRESRIRNKLSGYLTGNGFYEVWNNSLTSLGYEDLMEQQADGMAPVKILNPLSQDLGVLRRSLLFGMMENVIHNANRKQEDIRIFESGAEYHKREDASDQDPVIERFFERQVLSLLMTGKDVTESWYRKQREIAFYDLKRYADEMLHICGLGPEEFRIKDETEGIFDYGLTYSVGKRKILRLGSINRKIRKHFQIKTPVFYAEFDMEVLLKATSLQKIVAVPLPRFPDVRRDLSLIIDQQVRYEDLRNAVLATDSRLIREVLLFDVYQAENLPPGKKSYAIGIVLRDMEKTLSERDIDKVMQKVINHLHKTFEAVLR
ncbi:MAG: phenylalanine--tRNA ligase subunit beta [Bacteroidales bacterium]